MVSALVLIVCPEMSYTMYENTHVYISIYKHVCNVQMKNQIIILHSCTNGNNSMYHRNNHMYIHIIYIYTCTYYINIFVFIAFYIYPPGPLSTQKNSKLGFLTSTPSFSMMACLVTGPAAKCTFGTPQPKEKTGWSGSTHLKKTCSSKWDFSSNRGEHKKHM